ncbi:MAG TPA: S4 domain-containing protein [Spongiibacteraceae bacterium]|jgi:ribosome-associated heat shock protein Hsp15
MSEAAVRLDKWLWAARFFKTRNLAKQAIESGKVRYNEQRCKVSREVEIGARLNIPQGWDDIDVDVIALSDQRGPAARARLLYAETEASAQRRTQAAAQRKAAALSTPLTPERPNKKQRRQLEQLKRELFD